MTQQKRDPRLLALRLIRQHDLPKFQTIVADALSAAGFQRKAAAKALGVTRCTLHRWLRDMPALAAEVAYREQRMAESYSGMTPELRPEYQ